MNAQRVLKYQNEYGSGNYSCFYNANTGKVFQMRLMTEMGMIQALLWPSIGIFACILAAVILALIYGCKYVFVINAPSEVKDAAKTLVQNGKGLGFNIQHDEFVALKPVKPSYGSF